MKRGRKPFDPPCPQGYPYRLYTVGDTLKVGLSKEEIRKSTKQKNVKLANIVQLISANGHTKTNAILMEQGSRWICKEGHVFFAV